MDQIIEFIEKVSMIDIIDVLIALAIMIFFRVFSSAFSYVIIRIFKFKAKSSREIKEGAFYKPLKVFFTILGFYLGILFLKKPLNINDEVMQVVTKIFEIIVTLAFAKGLAASFRLDSTFVKRLRKKLDSKLDDTMFEFVLKIIRCLIYIIAVFIIIALLGINLSALVAGLGIGGVIVTLAAQDTAKNLFGGMVIFIDKPFNVGDWVQIEKFEGAVEDITFRSTRIRTSDNSVVNIPNSIVSEASVVNWSKLEKRRYTMDLCIELETPLEKVEKFKMELEETLKNRENIIEDSIVVKFNAINQNEIVIYVSVYTSIVDYAQYLDEKETINYEIMKILRQQGIRLANETRNIHIVS